jgi:hypothetical protein
MPTVVDLCVTEKVSDRKNLHETKLDEIKSTGQEIL